MESLVRIGDYVWSDGIFSPSRLDREEEPVGRCFYVNPENPSERLMYGLKPLPDCIFGLVDVWVPDSEFYLPKLCGQPFIGDSFLFKTDNYTDESPFSLDGFKDYRSLIGETYMTEKTDDPGMAAGQIGFCTLPTDVEDIPEKPSKYAILCEDKWIIPKGTRVPWGFIQTLSLIKHRNKVLEKKRYAMPKELWIEIDRSRNIEYVGSFWPAPSLCYTSSWFLPAIGDLIRIFHHGGPEKKKYWSSTISRGQRAWFMDFRNGITHFTSWYDILSIIPVTDF